jgi:hypothetical protein
VIDTVLYVPNDHTPIALRYTATAGLAPNTSYYLKVRFTVGTSPSPGTNRGMTWNPSTHAWVPDLGGSNWSDYPVVTTDSGGALIASSQWVWVKFADESESGVYHIMISLSPVAGSGAINSSLLPTVTVMSMETEGAWVHNGTAVSGTPQAKRAECTSETSSGVVYALAKTEADLVDNDDNGVVDDENYGPAGAAGDFRLGIPVGVPFNAYVNKPTIYAASQQIDIADTDIALSAADVTAPTAPGTLLVESSAYENELTWGAATDAGGSGLAGYRVYRRLASGSDAYTLPWNLIGLTASDVTAFTDPDLDKGVAYSYEVRAYDVATPVRAHSGVARRSASLRSPSQTRTRLQRTAC